MARVNIDKIGDHITNASDAAGRKAAQSDNPGRRHPNHHRLQIRSGKHAGNRQEQIFRERGFVNQIKKRGDRAGPPLNLKMQE